MESETVMLITFDKYRFGKYKKEKITPQTGAEMFHWHWYIYLAQ